MTDQPKASQLAKADALEVLRPGLRVGGNIQRVLRMSEAEAFWKLGDREQARQAAKHSLVLAPSDTKRREMRERLAPILEDEEPGMGEQHQLLDEQIAYYRARAAEYDDWWFRRGRYDRGGAQRPASNGPAKAGHY